MMKRRYFTLLLFLLSLVLACSGPSVKPSSETSNDGMKALRKGIGWYQKGCYHNSLEHFTRAAELFAASDHLAGTAMTMNNIGNVYRLIGDSKSAALFFDEAYAIYVDLNQPEGAIQALANKSALFIDDNAFDKAETVIQKAESMAAAAGIASVSLLNNKGVLLTKKKDTPAAETVLKSALAAAAPEDFRSIATVNASLGNLQLERGDYEKAIVFFSRALEMDRKADFPIGIADDLTDIGTAYYLQKKYDPALHYFRRGIKIHAIYGNQEKVTFITGMMETAADATGADIRITRHFVNKWTAGDLMTSPCK
jgi:tetratricopeptide (TPR) repeat protein